MRNVNVLKLLEGLPSESLKKSRDVHLLATSVFEQMQPLLASGYTLRQIYDALRHSGDIAIISFSTFSRRYAEYKKGDETEVSTPARAKKEKTEQGGSVVAAETQPAAIENPAPADPVDLSDEASTAPEPEKTGTAPASKISMASPLRPPRRQEKPQKKEVDPVLYDSEPDNIIGASEVNWGEVDQNFDIRQFV